MTKTITFILACFFVIGGACESQNEDIAGGRGNSDADTDSDSDGDTDADNDGDSDGDTDSDSDGDTDSDSDGDTDSDSDGDSDSDTDSDSDGDTDVSCAPDGDTKCVGDTFMTCTGGVWTTTNDCTGASPFCDHLLGCLVCKPGNRTCQGDNVALCNADGSGSSIIEECPPGEGCVNGGCDNACGEASKSNSYLGCEFMAVSTSNAILDPAFDNDFAVVIGNPAGTVTADVTVSRGASVVTTASVAPGNTQAITLAMVSELKNAMSSVQVADAAYEIKSNVPVVAYQYNPLNFTTGAGVFSYTNDASLLLPVHTLTGNYMASTWPTWGKGSWQNVPLLGVEGDWNSWYPGFVTIAGTVDGTSVTITSSTQTSDGTPGALQPGQTATITLNRGDVVQVYSMRPSGNHSKISYCSDQGWQQTNDGACPPTILNECDAFCSVTDGDLTGTKVEANQPVAVFAGHMCTFMPYYSWACDHLEEMMLPVETWGDKVVMTAPIAPNGSGPVRTLYRVLARNDGTDVTFNPAVTAGTSLNAGEFVQFETDQDFMVESNRQIFVTQTMLGETEINAGGGDPAMGSGIPVFQSRESYSFLVPDTYTSNYINVVALTGSMVYLDGVALTDWHTIGTTGYSVARVLVNPGSHTAESKDGDGFLITSYGYASFTSYLYPGGLNLNEFPIV